ncbi:unnamed protein product [Gulo gulo]|uniref:Uncharacterized protein n=1 Tax=Gulo gulo TaxID=48420 RepID=A0A9X9LVK5_GULGU|nr:unnamed protein product [Gulo gulo]
MCIYVFLKGKYCNSVICTLFFETLTSPPNKTKPDFTRIPYTEDIAAGTLYF